MKKVSLGSAHTREDRIQRLSIIIHPFCRGDNKSLWMDEWKANGSPLTAHGYGDRISKGQAWSGKLTELLRTKWARELFLNATLSSARQVHLYSCRDYVTIWTAAYYAGAPHGNITRCESCSGHGEVPR